MRRKLPKGVRMYTGDDFNFAELIEGDERGYSDALLGIFDAIAPAASQALSFLSRGTKSGIPRSTGAHRAALAPHLPRADALLQDRRGVHGVAERPPGPLRHGRRPAVGAQHPASFGTLPPGGCCGPAHGRSAARLRAHEAASGGARMRLRKLGSFGAEADTIDPDFGKVERVLRFAGAGISGGRGSRRRAFSRSPGSSASRSRTSSISSTIPSTPTSSSFPTCSKTASRSGSPTPARTSTPITRTSTCRRARPRCTRSRCRRRAAIRYSPISTRPTMACPPRMKKRIEGLVALHHYGNRDDQDKSSRTVARCSAKSRSRR